MIGGGTKCLPVSKQRLSHWIVDAIALAYDSQDVLCTIGGIGVRLPHGHGQRVCLSKTSAQQQDGLHKTLFPGSITWMHLC